MVKDKARLTGPFHYRVGNVIVAGGGHLESFGTGEAGDLGQVMLVPRLRQDLISTPQDDRVNGFYTCFGGGRAIVSTEAPIIQGKIIRTATLEGNKYLEDLDGANAVEPSDGESDDEDHEICESCCPVAEGGRYSITTQRLLHCMIGPHAGIARMNKTLKMADGLPSVPFKRLKYLCPGCLMGKMKRPSVPANAVRRKAALKMPVEDRSKVVILCFDMFEASRNVPS
jgi:hypothetical protein